MASEGEETVRLIRQDSGVPRSRKWAAVISIPVAAALVGAVGLFQVKKRSTAASLRSSIGLADGWYCEHFEGTDLDMAWCEAGPRDSEFEYKASNAPGFAGCGGCGCCKRPLGAAGASPSPSPLFTAKGDGSSAAATTTPSTTAAATTPSTTVTISRSKWAPFRESATNSSKHRAGLFPWQCDYFKNDTNKDNVSCADGPNPLNGNLGCKVMTESGFEGCGGCGCCNLPVKGEIGSPEKPVTQSKKPAEDDWMCHILGSGQDMDWCKAKHQEGGVKYAPSSEVGFCGGCDCCVKLIGGDTPYAPPASRPLLTTSSYQPHEMGWECAKDEEFPAGLNVEWCMQKPRRFGNFEYAAHDANIPAFGGCGCSCCRRVAGPYFGINQSTYKELPEVYVIYLPEVDSDVQRMHKFYMDAYLYLPGNAARVTEWPGVDCRQWPWGGRLNVVDKYMPTLKRDPKTTEDVWQWWRAPSNWQVNFARTTPDGHSLSGFPHHCGCSMSHLTVWLDARQRGVHPVLVSESDGGVSRFEWAGSGYVEDFSAVAIELAKTESTEWDLIIFDKCRMGWTGYGGFHINVPGLKGKYFAYHFGGFNVAGAAMYMVSKSFLDKLDDMIIETSYNMIDAWRDGKCQDGTLRCFTVCAFCEKEENTEEFRVLLDS